ncbi:PREDICTED: formin-binding protein 4 isoform X2 [Tarenaya hassleriana]|uniref:formin-binding protein 4 isoform X2 n=1 Tax=Tarenaya hassleriana TaxID=28532 RepID=UPI00053C713A|nr:PREDICTED: formin-binding protein 4 isoform X2 [Tarenaya hassleriana]
MGKRKDRRLAAMSNAGRRVKLDLFVEPPGDLGGSDARDRDDREQTDLNELPNSPSSSGQKTENPLLLLGQYSDDELEDSVERIKDVTVDSSLADNTKQAEGSPHGGHKDTDVKSDADTVMQTVDQQSSEKDSCASDVLAEKDGGKVTASDSTDSFGLHKQSDSLMQASSMVSSDLHATGDVSSQWKMILHEESKQYYYWNTETGETSWEVPEIFTQIALVGNDEETYAVGYSESGPMGAYESNLVLNVAPSQFLAVPNIISGPESLTSLKTVNGIVHQTEALNDGYKSEDLKSKPLGTDGDQSECQTTSAVSLPCHEKLAGPGNSSEYVLANSDNGAATDLPTLLLGQSERLLEKLRSLEKSHGSLPGNERIAKYILEVEIRCSDIKALSSDASSLLLFWLHTEKQLNQLEESINNEIYELAKSAVMDDIAAIDRNSLEEKEKSVDSTGSELEDSGIEGERAHPGKAPNRDELAGENVGSHYGRDSVRESDVTDSNEMFEKTCLPVVEDDDLDVDMEVEEFVPPFEAPGGEILGQTEQTNLHTDATGPPPPGEEWTPPPPPPDSEEVPPPPPPPDTDNELIPPPPPDDGQVPPAPADKLQGLSYMSCQSYAQQSATHYDLSYPGSNYQYYGNVVAQTPDNLLYGPVDGSQVSLPQSSFYYGTVSTTSFESAPGTTNGVETYYSFKEGIAPLFPVISSVESSLHHTGVNSINHSVVNVQPTDASAVLETSSTANAKESVSISSQSTDAVANSTVSSKGQSKVARPKRRPVAVASSLRSNKKVSSLVDKWKAAKEELNESEEEEPENAYEILERKRQREIEEWKARQIASGEAKENANFQPLGGDWREKVKRKRQQAAREAGETKKGKNQQTPDDLTKISANLPSGWQAYWDESSKQIYYGNKATSQTTWTRPTSLSGEREGKGSRLPPPSMPARTLSTLQNVAIWRMKNPVSFRLPHALHSLSSFEAPKVVVNRSLTLKNLLLK